MFTNHLQFFNFIAWILAAAAAGALPAHAILGFLSPNKYAALWRIVHAHGSLLILFCWNARE